MALIKINGREYFVDCSSLQVEPVSAGRWNVTYDRVVGDDGKVISEGRTFLVVGGRASGGGAREWFYHHPEFTGEQWVPKSTMICAVRGGVQY